MVDYGASSLIWCDGEVGDFGEIYHARHFIELPVEGLKRCLIDQQVLVNSY